MIPNWKYWTFIVLVGMVPGIYHVMYDLGLWRNLPILVLGIIYAAFFDKYRKTIVEVDK